MEIINLIATNSLSRGTFHFYGLDSALAGVHSLELPQEQEDEIKESIYEIAALLKYRFRNVLSEQLLEEIYI